MTTTATAQDIESVIAQLEAIIHQCESTGDRLGYFAALYHKVTCKVKEDIDNKLFEDGSRLAELDVVFANRYLCAYSQWKADKNSPLVSASWRVAFKSAEASSYLVLHHLLLGMNAHINYDLGIAVAELAAKGNDVDALRRDYNSINNVLGALTYGVINKLNIVSPFLSVLGFTGTNSNSMLVQFSLGTARDGAWLFATDLIACGTDTQKYTDLTLKRDTEISELGTLLTQSKGFLKFGIFIIRLFEWKNVKKVIEVLHTHQKLRFSEVKANIKR
ncbi:DUF5995 family protein [Flavobacterium sp. RHBU_3]|uniref:DUF5995 family protein n=1 Tax=Flavobacterium sp. RHBU_3 TaxID=3391184 RepID=UPI003984650E